MLQHKHELKANLEIRFHLWIWGRNEFMKFWHCAQKFKPRECALCTENMLQPPFTANKLSAIVLISAIHLIYEDNPTYEIRAKRDIGFWWCLYTHRIAHISFTGLPTQD